MPIWMTATEWIARLILVGLVFLSVWSVAILIDRKKYFSSLDFEGFLKKLQDKAGAFHPEKVSQALANDIFMKRMEMEKGLSILGTLGSTTPFIGLLGTILGIIVAFGELSQGQGDTNAVMFALAEALILTAVGLFVAIPAVIGFNIFKKKNREFLDRLKSEMDFYLAKRNEQ